MDDAQSKAIDEVLNGKHGTPKTLHEAIALATMCGPLKGMDRRILAAVIDFLAQRFGVAMLTYPELDEHFKELYDRIIEPPFKKEPKTLEEFKRENSIPDSGS